MSISLIISKTSYIGDDQKLSTQLPAFWMTLAVQQHTAKDCSRTFCKLFKCDALNMGSCSITLFWIRPIYVIMIYISSDSLHLNEILKFCILLWYYG